MADLILKRQRWVDADVRYRWQLTLTQFDSNSSTIFTVLLKNILKRFLDHCPSDLPLPILRVFFFSLWPACFVVLHCSQRRDRFSTHSLAVFSIVLPCVGNVSGVVLFTVGLDIMTRRGRRVRGMPLRLRLKKECRISHGTDKDQ